MIVVLAGHVDHGKTTLIELITGKNTDTLKEERARGLTIDLGFAFLNTNTGSLGFVDVPGHQRFIHNMIAGLSKNQFALLTIAADDGPMPQTEEHLQLLQFAGIEMGCIVITKSDLVSPEQLNRVKRASKHLVKETFLHDSPIFITSNEDITSIKTLATYLQTQKDLVPNLIDENPMRMAIDRAFNIHGTGTIVTGTIASGTLVKEKRLYVYPANKPVRVKSIHSQDQKTLKAITGDRCAINISGLSLDELERGSWLCEMEQTGAKTFFAETLHLNNSDQQSFREVPVHIYHGSSHTLGKMIRLKSLTGKENARDLIQLKTEKPVFCKHGDRLIIRNFSLTATLTGAVVILNSNVPGRLNDKGRLAFIDAHREASPDSTIDRLLQVGPYALSTNKSNWNIDKEHMTQLLSKKNVVLVGDYAISKDIWSNWRKIILRTVVSTLSADSTKTGLQINEIKSTIPKDILPTVIKDLVSNGYLMEESGRVSHLQHSSKLSSTEKQLLTTISKHLNSFQPPPLGDLVDLTGIPRSKLSALLSSIVKKGELVQISSTRYYLKPKLQELIDIARELDRIGPFDVRSFRDQASIGRNTAIDLLEYFDSLGYTKRIGTNRVMTNKESPVR